MKKMNKKGFTIVELVIVIAVIAILAAVMIPTFGGIIEIANKSAAEQKVSAAFKEAYAEALLAGKGDIKAGDYDVDGGYTFTYGNSGWSVEVDDSDYDFTYSDGAWTANDKT